MCKGPEAGQAYGKGEDEQKGQCSWSTESKGEARSSMRQEVGRNQITEGHAGSFK